MWKRALFALIYGLVSCSAAPPGVDIPPGAKLALVNGTLINGTGAKPIKNAVLAVGADGKIVAAGRRGDGPIPAGTTVVDVGGATILPGFINAHVHVVNGDPLEDLAALTNVRLVIHLGAIIRGR